MHRNRRGDGQMRTTTPTHIAKLRERLLHAGQILDRNRRRLSRYVPQIDITGRGRAIEHQPHFRPGTTGWAVAVRNSRPQPEQRWRRYRVGGVWLGVDFQATVLGSDDDQCITAEHPQSGRDNRTTVDTGSQTHKPKTTVTLSRCEELSPVLAGHAVCLPSITSQYVKRVQPQVCALRVN